MKVASCALVALALGTHSSLVLARDAAFDSSNGHVLALSPRDGPARMHHQLRKRQGLSLGGLGVAANSDTSAAAPASTTPAAQTSAPAAASSAAATTPAAASATSAAPATSEDAATSESSAAPVPASSSSSSSAPAEVSSASSAPVESSTSSSTTARDRSSASSATDASSSAASASESASSASSGSASASSASGSASASAAADKKDSSSGGISKATLIPIIVVASCVAGVAAIWTIIRKTKFSPSRKFEAKLEPIDFVPDHDDPAHGLVGGNGQHQRNMSQMSGGNGGAYAGGYAASLARSDSGKNSVRGGVAMSESLHAIPYNGPQYVQAPYYGAPAYGNNVQPGYPHEQAYGGYADLQRGNSYSHQQQAHHLPMPGSPSLGRMPSYAVQQRTASPAPQVAQAYDYAAQARSQSRAQQRY
ncbi:hypothetical protein JCM8097_004659 [Rhodosporidiobolus ruineniae]